MRILKQPSTIRTKPFIYKPTTPLCLKNPAKSPVLGERRNKVCDIIQKKIIELESKFEKLIDPFTEVREMQIRLLIWNGRGLALTSLALLSRPLQSKLITRPFVRKVTERVEKYELSLFEVYQNLLKLISIRVSDGETDQLNSKEDLFGDKVRLVFKSIHLVNKDLDHLNEVISELSDIAGFIPLIDFLEEIPPLAAERDLKRSDLLFLEIIEYLAENLSTEHYPFFGPVPGDESMPLEFNPKSLDCCL